MFIVISGPSGSGKNTIIKELLKKHPSWEFVKSVTTRPPRGEGLHIHMTNEEFLKGVEKGEFFEHEPMHGNFYVGILSASIKKIESEKDKVFLKDVDVKGTQKLVKYFDGTNILLTIFVDAPDEELKKRLAFRGESQERIDVRLSRASMEREYKDKYDHVIVNSSLQESVKNVEKLIKNHQKKQK